MHWQKVLNRVAAATLLGMTMATAALAEEAVPAAAVEEPAPAPAAATIRPLLGLGLTFGGDTLATTIFTNGDQTNIKAGQLLQLYGGLVYQASPMVSVQATAGYHFQNSSADNGSVRFKRFPIELLAHYHVNDAWQFGGGMRFVSGAKLSASGVASNVPTVEFGSTIGTVIEGEYRTSPQLGFKLRYVSEKYETKAPFAGTTVDGSHVGLMMNWYL